MSLKADIESIKKFQKEEYLKAETLGTQTRNSEASPTWDGSKNPRQNGHIEEIDTATKENIKSKINPAIKHTGNLKTMKIPNLRITETE